MPRMILTKCEQTEQRIWEQVRDGEYRIGDRLPSLPSLSQTLGVSRDTVRLALSRLIRDGVLISRPGYGHVVRSQKRRRTVGLWVSGNALRRPSSPFHPLLFDALRSELRKRRCHARVFMPTAGDGTTRASHQRLIDAMQRGHLGGVIGVNVGQTQRELNRLIVNPAAQHQLPWAVINDSKLPQTTTLDYEAVTRTGVEALVGQGATRIAMVTSSHRFKDCLAGYQQGLGSVGIKYNANWVIDTLNHEAAGYITMRETWPKLNKSRVDGIVMSDDMAAKGVISAAAEMGIDIPQRLKISSLAIHGSNTFFTRPFTGLWLDPVEVARAVIKQMEASETSNEPIPLCLVQPVVEAYQPPWMDSTSTQEASP